MRYRRYRKIRRFLNRGIGFRLYRVFLAFVYALLFALVLLLGLVLLAENRINYTLDWNTIITIIIAEIPAGLFLWFILERRESKTTRILNLVERLKTQALFKDVGIHFSDKWDSAEYPYLNYFIVNTKTKMAFQVSEETEDLVEEGLIPVYPRYRNFDELNRYFEHNGIKIEHRIATGEDLGLSGS